MLKIIYLEFLKLKRSKILYFFLAVSAVTVLANLNSHILISQYPDKRWLLFLGKTQLFICFYSPVFVNVFSGYIFVREYRDGTMDYLFTSPVSRLKLLSGKMLATIPVMVIMFLGIVLLNVIVGFFLNLGKFPFENFFFNIALIPLLVLLHFIIIPIIVLLSNITKSNIFNTIFSVFVYFLGILLFQTNYKVFFPWCFPGIVLMKLLGKDAFVEFSRMSIGMTESKFMYALIVFSITAGISCLLSAVFFKRQECI